MHIKRAKVSGKYKSTKTKRSSRKIELLKPARDALKAQYELSFNQRPETVDITDRDNRTIKNESLRFVFLDSTTGKAINSDCSLRAYFFKPHLENAEIRYRGPGQCRHTFASQMLTAGMPHDWIAMQMGHNSTEMVTRKYEKWIHEDADDWVKIAEDRLNLG